MEISGRLGNRLDDNIITQTLRTQQMLREADNSTNSTEFEVECLDSRSLVLQLL